MGARWCCLLSVVTLGGCAEMPLRATPPTPAPTAAVHSVPADHSPDSPTDNNPHGSAAPAPTSASATRSLTPTTDPVGQLNTMPTKPAHPEKLRPASPASTLGMQAKSTTPALDLAAMEQRLRDTHAIGLMTKLSLKNQVDDLLTDFRKLYGGQLKVPLAELRQKFDLLLLKVLSLLQDSDAQLATAIASSREAIWGILADPQKFSKI